MCSIWEIPAQGQTKYDAWGQITLGDQTVLRGHVDNWKKPDARKLEIPMTLVAGEERTVKLRVPIK